MITGASSGRVPLEEILLRPSSNSAVSEISCAVRVIPSSSRPWCVTGTRAGSSPATGSADLNAEEISALAIGFASRSNAGPKVSPSGVCRRDDANLRRARLITSNEAPTKQLYRADPSTPPGGAYGQGWSGSLRAAAPERSRSLQNARLPIRSTTGPIHAVPVQAIRRPGSNVPGKVCARACIPCRGTAPRTVRSIADRARVQICFRRGPSWLNVNARVRRAFRASRRTRPPRYNCRNMQEQIRREGQAEISHHTSSSSFLHAGSTMQMNTRSFAPGFRMNCAAFGGI